MQNFVLQEKKGTFRDTGKGMILFHIPFYNRIRKIKAYTNFKCAQNVWFECMILMEA